MTENIIIFAVDSDKKPKEMLTEKISGLYNIKEYIPPEELKKRVADKDLNWYQGETYFAQRHALKQLGKQYREKLYFFGFTCWDCDFS